MIRLCVTVVVSQIVFCLGVVKKDTLPAHLWHNPKYAPKSSNATDTKHVALSAAQVSYATQADAIPPEPPNYDSDDTSEPNYVFTQADVANDLALKDCILVDTGSSVNTFGTSTYVSNIRHASCPLTTNSTGGLQQYTQHATFLGFMDV